MEMDKSEIHKSEMDEHLNFRNYMRDLILGVNDGLVSVFALVLGVAGAGFLPINVLLAGIAAAVAGAISMAIGEYISTKSQEQVYDAEKELERQHIRDHLDHEIEELYEFYSAKGFEGKLLDQIVEKIASDEDVLLKEMMLFEFGVLEEERRSPIKATVIIGIAFLVGALPPIIPFIFVNETSVGILWSTIFSLFGLFMVGWIKGVLVKSNRVLDGLENFGLGAAGAAITYLIGLMVGTSV